MAILRRFKIENCNRRKTPLDANSFLLRLTNPVNLDRQTHY